MYDIISRYMDKLTKENIITFAQNNDINLSEEEATFIYDFLEKNWSELLGSPDTLVMSRYKDKFSEDNYLKLDRLVNQYRNKYFKR